MYLNIAKLNGMALRVFPEEYRTPEVYLEAVKSSDTSGIFRYIPDEMRTEEMYLEFFRRNSPLGVSDSISLIRYISSTGHELMNEDCAMRLISMICSPHGLQ